MTTKRKTIKTTGRRERVTVISKSAVAVMGFMNGPAPDFLSTIVMQAIDNACDHVGFARLMYEPGFEKDDLRLLTNLCRKTRLLELKELEGSPASLARHIKSILEHPLCSGALKESLLEFITEVQNHRVYGKDSLANEWLTDQKVLERVIEKAREYEQAPPEQRGTEVRA